MLMLWAHTIVCACTVYDGKLLGRIHRIRRIREKKTDHIQSEIRNSQIISFSSALPAFQMIGVNSSAINRCSIIKYCYIEFSTIIIRSSIIKIITANFMNSTVNRCVAPSRRFDSSMFLWCCWLLVLSLSHLHHFDSTIFALHFDVSRTQQIIAANLVVRITTCLN